MTGVESGVAFYCCSPPASKFDDLLHTLVVTSVCLRYSCLSISTEQFLAILHWLLTFGINMAFSPRGLLLTGSFQVFRSFSVSPVDGCAHKQSEWSDGTNMLDLNSTRVFWPCLNYCHVIGWWHVCVKKAVERVSLMKWPVSVYCFLWGYLRFFF